MKLVALGLAAVIISGCVSADYVQLGEKTYPPRPDDWAIDIYVADEAPVIVHKSISQPKTIKDIPANAEMIGRVDAIGAPAASWDSVIRVAKEKARAIGGDGLVVGAWGHHLAGIGSYGVAYHGKDLALSVIRYRGNSPPPPQTPEEQRARTFGPAQRATQRY